MKKLWATTKYFGKTIKIYKVPNSDKYEGYTLTDKPTCVYICEDLFDKPKKLDELLLHEFIHVVEHLRGLDALGHEQIKDSWGYACTKSATVLGRALAMMLRNLEQVTENKPRRLRKRSS